MSLQTNDKAPDFTLPSTSGENFKLSDNVPCIIYFYPKDFTPGCTKEACTFRDGFSELKGFDIDVYGISRDTIPSHEKFKSKNNLQFDLLSDINGNVCKAFDALVPVVKIPKRVTYLIDEDMSIKAVYSDLFGFKKHLTQMISELKVE